MAFPSIFTQSRMRMLAAILATLIHVAPAWSANATDAIDAAARLLQERRPDEARREAERAIALAKRSSDAALIDRAYRSLMNIEIFARNYGAAIDAGVGSLEASRRSGNATAVWTAHVNIADVYQRSGRCLEATAPLQEARQLLAESQKAALSEVLTTLAFCFSQLDDLDAAESTVAEALVICEQLADEGCRSRTLLTRARLHVRRGKYEIAVRDLVESESAAVQANSRWLAIQNAQTRANVFLLMGRFAEALIACDVVRDYLTSNGYQPEQGIALFQQYALIYSALGRQDRAQFYSGEALRAARALARPDLIAAVLVANGRVAWQMKQFDAALASADEAIRLDPSVERLARLLRGSVLRERSQLDSASREFLAVLASARAAGRSGEESAALENLGATFSDAGDFERARAVLVDAVLLEERSGAPGFSVYARLARALAGLGRVDEAVFYGKQSVNRIQAIRRGTYGLDDATRQSLLSDQMRLAFVQLASWLVDRDRIDEARQVLRLLKSDEQASLLPFSEDEQAVASGVAPAASLTVIEAEMARKKAAIDANLVVLGREYRNLSTVPSKARTVIQQQRYEQLQKLLDRAHAEYRKYLEETEAAFRRAGRTEVTANSLSDAEGLQATLEQLGSGTVLVQFLMAPDSLRILLTTPYVQVARTSRIRESEMRALIAKYREVLQSPRRDPLPLAQELYRYVLGPIEADLAKAGARTLMLSLDGALRYLPVAALHDGQAWVVERFALATYLPAARDKIDEPRRAEWRVAAFGVSKESPGASALPSVPFELSAIVQQGGKSGTGGILPGRIALDEQFTEASLRSAFEERFPVIHLATHFSFAPRSAESSMLVLGGGSRLTLAQIQRNAYTMTGVDLIALSACQTALGDDASGGSEVEGLGVTLVRRGAASVLATLWSVADASTAKLMSRFYDLRQQRGLSKGEALREAQRELLATDYKHPYYWGPFVLMGNWR